MPDKLRSPVDAVPALGVRAVNECRQAGLEPDVSVDKKVFGSTPSGWIVSVSEVTHSTVASGPAGPSDREWTAWSYQVLTFDGRIVSVSGSPRRNGRIRVSLDAWARRIDRYQYTAEPVSVFQYLRDLDRFATDRRLPCRNAVAEALVSAEQAIPRPPFAGRNRITAADVAGRQVVWISHVQTDFDQWVHDWHADPRPGMREVDPATGIKAGDVIISVVHGPSVTAAMPPFLLEVIPASEASEPIHRGHVWMRETTRCFEGRTIKRDLLYPKNADFPGPLYFVGPEEIEFLFAT